MRETWLHHFLGQTVCNTALRMDSLTARPFVPARHIPDLHRAIAASRDEAPAVGAERQAHDHAGMAAQRLPPLPGLGVPENDRGVLARRGEPAAIRADGHSDDVAAMAGEATELLPGL